MTARDEVEELLRALHECEVNGQEESAEADLIRMAMEAPWKRLSEAEQDEMRELSEKLREEAQRG